MSADEREHQSTVHAIVLQNSFRKERAIGSAAADHPVDANHAGKDELQWGRAAQVHRSKQRIVGTVIRVEVGAAERVDARGNGR
jgi:hypothetical protein